MFKNTRYARSCLFCGRDTRRLDRICKRCLPNDCHPEDLVKRSGNPHEIDEDLDNEDTYHGDNLRDDS